MKKRILSVLLSIVMVITLMPSMSFAAGTVTVNTSTGNGYTITANSPMDTTGSTGYSFMVSVVSDYKIVDSSSDVTVRGNTSQKIVKATPSVVDVDTNAGTYVLSDVQTAEFSEDSSVTISVATSAMVWYAYETGAGGLSTIGPDDYYKPGKFVEAGSYPVTYKKDDFLYWRSNVGGGIYKPDDKFEMPDTPVTLTAVYADSGTTYSLTYAPGTAPGSSSVGGSNRAGEYVTVGSNSYTNDGYTFVGWRSNVGGTVYQPGDKFLMPATAVTLTAQWAKNDTTYTVIYDKGESTDVTHTVTDSNSPYVAGAYVTTQPNAYEYEGYTFSGWKSDVGSTIYQPGEKFEMPATNVTLTAQWAKDDETYTVSFDTDGGTSSATTMGSLKAGDIVSILYDATKADCDFDGWRADYNGITGLLQNGDRFVMPATDVKLTAQWTSTAVTQKNVEYKDLKSDGTENVGPKDVGSYITVKNSPTAVSGYTFTGWRSNVGNIVYLPGDKFLMPATDVTLTAKWVENAKTYAVTYNRGTTSGGETVTGSEPTDSTSYAAGAYVTVADKELLSCTGYDFVGWRSNVGGTIYQPGDHMEMPATAVTLTAQWAKNASTYTVTYNKGTTSGGEDVTGSGPTDSTSYAAGAYVTVADKESLSCTDYTFVGWRSNVGGTVYQPSDRMEMPATDVTLTAQWVKNDTKYSITYKSDGHGDDITDSDTYVAGAYPETKSNTYTYTGYHFTGWKSSVGGTIYQQQERFEMPATNVILTAQWAKDDETYTVSFDTAGGEPTSIDPLNNKKAGDIVTISASANWTDYRFDGWRADYNGITGLLQNGDKFVMPATDVKLTAQWTSTAVTQKNVEYKDLKSDGTENVGPKDVGSYITVKNSPTAVSGYTFTGWRSNVGNIVYLPGDKFLMPATDVELTAQWSENATMYTLYKDENYGTSVKEIVGTVERGKEISVPGAPYRADYEFLCWNTQSDGQGTTYTLGSSVMMYSDVTLYAQWKCTKTYTITFGNGQAMAQGLGGTDITVKGSAPSMEPRTEGTTIELPQNPFSIQNKADGTSFVMTGWKCNQGSQLTYAPGSEYTMTAANTTFTAQWAKIDPNQAYVVYNANGGINPPVDYRVYGKGDNATVKAPGAMTRSGYKFIGWAETKDATSSTYQPDQTIVLSMAGLKELFAVWEEVPTYTLKYDANYGSTGTGTAPQDDKKYADGEIFEVKGCGTLTKTAGTKEYYVFSGWNTKKNGTGEAIAPGSSLEMTEDRRQYDDDGDVNKLTLYAVWTGVAFDTYPVIYDLAGGTEASTGACKTKSYVKGATVTTAAAPSKEGYTFRHWAFNSVGGAACAAGAEFPMPAETVYLIAIWDKQCTVSYNSNYPTGTNVTKTDDNSGQYYYIGGETRPIVKNNTDTAIDFKCNKCSFIGWNTQPSGSGDTYKAGDTLTVTGDVVLYAQWSSEYKLVFSDNLEEPLHDYVVVTDKDGSKPIGKISPYGTVERTDLSATGAIGNVPAFTRVNYCFSGWYTNKGCTERFDLTDHNLETLDTNDGTPDKTVTIYAKWVWAPNGTVDSMNDKVTIQTSELDNGTYGIYYSDYIDAFDRNYSELPVYRNFAIRSGELQEGLFLNARTGEIYGVPKEAGDKVLTFYMMNDEGRTISDADKTITIHVDQIPLTLDHKTTNECIYEKTYGDNEDQATPLSYPLPTKPKGLTYSSQNLTFKLRNIDLEGGIDYFCFTSLGNCTKVILETGGATASFVYTYSDADTERSNRAVFDPTNTATLKNATDIGTDHPSKIEELKFTETVTAPMKRVSGEDADTYKIYLKNDDSLTIKTEEVDTKANYMVTIPETFSTEDKTDAAGYYLFTINKRDTTFTPGVTYGDIKLNASITGTGTFTNDAPVNNDEIHILDKEDVKLTGTEGLTSSSGHLTAGSHPASDYSIDVTFANQADPLGTKSQNTTGNYNVTKSDSDFEVAKRPLKVAETKAVSVTKGTTFADASVKAMLTLVGKTDVSQAVISGDKVSLEIDLSSCEYYKDSTKLENLADFESALNDAAKASGDYSGFKIKYIGASLTGDDKDNYSIDPTFGEVEITLTVKESGGGGGGGGGGGAGVAVYEISVAAAEHGKVTASAKTAAAGSTITITAAPEEGYQLDTVTVKDEKGKEIALTTPQDSNTRTFIMPASKVAVTATFKEETKPRNFVDVNEKDYFYNAVYWAVDEEITEGMDETHFAPNKDCTRAQMVTFIWRSAGCPESTLTSTSFTDVDEKEYYYQALLWAVEKKIVGGTSPTEFSPDQPVTRGQAVTFLYRFSGETAEGTGTSFSDVSAKEYFAEAVQWAVKKGITEGTGDGKFSPYLNCNRAQIVTFLYRYNVK